MIKNHTKLNRLRQLLIISLPVLLVSCQQSGNRQDQSRYAGACVNNTYLAKYDCSIERIQRAAEDGSADAQYALGYMYYYGISTTRDRETATLWIKRSADQGQPLAKKALSLIQSGTHFSDLHHAAGGSHHAVSGTRRRGGGGGTSLYQPPADVNTMNAAAPEKPIHDVLPNYQGSRANKKAPVLDALKHDSDKEAENSLKTTPAPEKPAVNTSAEKPAVKTSALKDPRLSKHAKPIVAKHVQKQDNGYTVQLMASHHLPALKAYVKKQGLAKEARYYKTMLKNKSWYVLTYGRYSSKSEAENALQKLPKQALTNHPWVKSMHALAKDKRLRA